MRNRSAQQAILKVLSILMLFGGFVRLVAGRQTFRSFMIEELWVPHPYFIYIYRVLGAFVIFTAVTLFVIARDPIRYAKILKVGGFFFAFVGLVMLIAGYSLHMSLLHYAFDFLFCFLIALLCFFFWGTHRTRN
jgi:hypothetical protein